MKERNTFAEVLHNCDDQVIVRKLLTDVLTDIQKCTVLARFNKEVRIREGIKNGYTTKQ